MSTIRNPSPSLSGTLATERTLLLFATAALRDLSTGFPASEIAAPSGTGLEALLVDLVGHLRGEGIDDEGGWDCPATRAIPVASARRDNAAHLTEELLALKARGLDFGSVVHVFGEDGDANVYVKAARELKTVDGEIEVDGVAVVSQGNDRGAYVGSWVWVSDAEAGILAHSTALEALLDHARAITVDAPASLATPPNTPPSPELFLSVYMDWLEDLLSNFADELDELEPSSASAPPCEPIAWFDHGQTFRFHPSEALHALCSLVDGAGVDAASVRAAKSVAATHGSALDRMLAVVQTRG